MLKRFLLSPRTIIFLILAAGAACVVGSVVPQLGDKPLLFFESWKAESPRIYYWVDLLQINQVFTSLWFFILVALIALSLSFSVFYQIKALLKSGKGVQRR